MDDGRMSFVRPVCCHSILQKTFPLVEGVRDRGATPITAFFRSIGNAPKERYRKSRYRPRFGEIRPCSSGNMLKIGMQVQMPSSLQFFNALGLSAPLR